MVFMSQNLHHTYLQTAEKRVCMYDTSCNIKFIRTVTSVVVLCRLERGITVQEVVHGSKLSMQVQSNLVKYFLKNKI